MKNSVYLLMVVLVAWIFSSCKMTESERLEVLLQQWNGKEISFPKNLPFMEYGEKRVDFDMSRGKYKIVHYVDSAGCTSCKLNLKQWDEFISYMDSVTGHAVPCLFYIHTKQKRELKIALKENGFDYPVCLDMGNEFYRLNKFPMTPLLQTFLLDADNRIIGMGDPVRNPRIKELYLNLINGKHGKQEMEQARTTAELSHKEIDFGTFFWEEKQDTVVKLVNTGEKLLVIHDISTSCGCTVADYTKQPARPGESLDVKVSFEAERPEYFKKNIVVHCNTDNSPLVFWVTGHARN